MSIDCIVLVRLLYCFKGAVSELSTRIYLPFSKKQEALEVYIACVSKKCLQHIQTETPQTFWREGNACHLGLKIRFGGRRILFRVILISDIDDIYKTQNKVR